LDEYRSHKKIPPSNRTRLFGKLRRPQRVKSVRGPGGGYCLAKELGSVSVSEIILAVDEPIDATQCGGKENCRDEQKCLTHDLWAALNERIFDYLGSVSLRQLVEEQKAKEAEQGTGVAQVHDMREPRKRGSTVPA